MLTKLIAVLIRETRILTFFGHDQEPLGRVGDTAVTLVVVPVVADREGIFKALTLGSKSDAGGIAQSHRVQFPVIEWCSYCPL